MKKILLGMAMSLLAITVHASPPASSGIVERSDGTFGLHYVDDSKNLTALVGFDPIIWCSGGQNWGVMSWADKFLKNPWRMNSIGKAEEVYVSVWGFIAGFTPDDCDLYLTQQPLATGSAQMIWQDNDWFGPYLCEEKNNMNAAGQMAHGTLYSPSGVPMQFSVVHRVLFDCDTETLPVEFTKIKLTGYPGN